MKFNVMAMYQSIKEATTYTLALFMKISPGVDTSKTWSDLDLKHNFLLNSHFEIEFKLIGSNF